MVVDYLQLQQKSKLIKGSMGVSQPKKTERIKLNTAHSTDTHTHITCNT